MKHKQTREGDEYACTCGLRWGVGEEDPHATRDVGAEVRRELKELFSDDD